MSAVVADTHSLIWYLFEPTQLSVKARAAFTTAETVAGLIHVFDQLITSLLDANTAPRIVSLDLDIARCLQQVPKSQVPDMPDRIIAATAVYLDLPLITRDHKIHASGIETIW